MAGTAQVITNGLASEWIIKAMAHASLKSAAELSRKSGIPEMTISNIINHKQKNGCRLDIVLALVESCGLTLELK
jgi:hypothetical protein